MRQPTANQSEIQRTRNSPEPGIVSKLVRHETSGEAERVTYLVQVVAELAHQRVLGGWASQKETIGRQGIEGAKEA